MQAAASLPRLALGLAAVVGAAWPHAATAQLLDSIPSQAYYLGVQELYRGELRDAQRTFARCLTGAVKTLSQGGTIRWVDSICYHAMLGETFYQWGQPEQALEQFNYACNLFLQYPRWLLRVQFNVQPTADATLARRVAPWGVATRTATPGKFPDTYPVAQGQLDQSQVVQQGGVVQQAQLWPVNVAEVVRCTALAIRRRNEILGPLGAHDAISKSLVTTLSRGGAPPNHWSNAWIDVLRGLAHEGVGEVEQALQYLDRGTLVAGQFDHPLTAIALLEEGKLALEAGNTASAAALIAEASYAAYRYEDAGTIDEAFRWGELNRVAANSLALNPSLQPAAAWARRERLDLIGARINLALADELMSAGDWKNAATALSAGASLLGNARTGILGNWAMYLEARLQYQQRRETARATLAAAIQGQIKISLQNFQINRANGMFDAQTLPTRSAGSVYELLLADPRPADTLLRPLETMAVMKTPHEAAFDRWLAATLDRKNVAGALEVTDRAKRRRFHNALPLGGRLAAVRDMLATPAAKLDARRREQQHDLLSRFPLVSQSIAAGDALRTELDAAWRPPLSDDSQRKSARLWGDYTAAMGQREDLLAQASLERVPADLAFPPMRTAAELQSRLEAGQALLVFHDSSEGLIGLLVTAKASTAWNCGPVGRVATLVSQALRDLGNVDANHEMTAEELASDQWHGSCEQLYNALLGGSGLSPAGMSELVVVPDGVTWYAPFEALIADVDGRKRPLVEFARVRYAPTAGLAFRFDGPWRRIQRTGVVAGALVPGERPDERTQAIASLLSAVPGPIQLAAPSPAPSPLMASLLDGLIVLDDVEAPSGDPLGWSPLPIDRAGQGGDLEDWLALPGIGPQRIALPGMHTLAERGGKAARRRGSAAVAGDDLFFASCGLMSAGAETLLMSRWRVGGQSTLDLMREFVQELPHTAAADAWQRSIQLAMERPVDPLAELRVKAGKEPVELMASHPFFWAGYMVIDSGWRPETEAQAAEAPAEPVAAAAPGAAAAAAAGQGSSKPAGKTPATPKPPVDDGNTPPAPSPPPAPTPPADDAAD
jgi:hypothetical protein